MLCPYMLSTVWCWRWRSLHVALALVISRLSHSNLSSWQSDRVANKGHCYALICGVQLVDYPHLDALSMFIAVLVRSLILPFLFCCYTCLRSRTVYLHEGTHSGLPLVSPHYNWKCSCVIQSLCFNLMHVLVSMHIHGHSYVLQHHHYCIIKSRSG